MTDYPPDLIYTVEKNERLRESNQRALRMGGELLLPESELKGLVRLNAGDVFSRQLLTESAKLIGDRKAARTGAAVLLGTLLTPLAAIIPLIETGPGKDSDCGELIASIGKNSQPAN